MFAGGRQWRVKFSVVQSAETGLVRMGLPGPPGAVGASGSTTAWGEGQHRTPVFWLAWLSLKFMQTYMCLPTWSGPGVNVLPLPAPGMNAIPLGGFTELTCAHDQVMLPVLMPSGSFTLPLAAVSRTPTLGPFAARLVPSAAVTDGVPVALLVCACVSVPAAATRTTMAAARNRGGSCRVRCSFPVAVVAFFKVVVFRAQLTRNYTPTLPSPPNPSPPPSAAPPCRSQAPPPMSFPSAAPPVVPKRRLGMRLAKRRLANLNRRNELRIGSGVRCEAALRGTHSQAALGNDRTESDAKQRFAGRIPKRRLGTTESLPPCGI